MVEPNRRYDSGDGASGDHEVRLGFAGRPSGLVVCEALRVIVPTLGAVVGPEARLMVEPCIKRSSWRGGTEALFIIATLRGMCDVLVKPLDAPGFTQEGACTGVSVDHYLRGGFNRRPTTAEVTVRAAGSAVVAVALAEALGPEYGPVMVLSKTEE